MKIKDLIKLIIPSVSCVLALSLTSCASYNASSLNNLSPDIIKTSSSAKSTDVILAAKVFDRRDCKKYLDRDVISKGYQPIQLYIENNTSKNYVFSLSRVSVPCATSEEVAQKVHTSTVGRAAGYGAAAFFTCGLFVIPAVIDGVKSAQANETLDNDFLLKAAKDQVVHSYSRLNMLLFVPIKSYEPNFNVTLIDQNSDQPRTFQVRTN